MKKTQIYYGVISIILTILAFNFFIYKGTDKIFAMIMLLINLINISVAYRKKWLNNKLENNFLVIYIGISIFFILCNPVGQTADEYMHFYRAYSIAEGKIYGERLDDGYSVGNYLPNELTSIEEAVGSVITLDRNIDISDYQNINQTGISNERRFYLLNNTLVYPPFSYIPQALGILLGRVLGCSILQVFLLGRLTNAVCYGILAYFAIHIIKQRYKLIIFSVALFPISVYLGTSISMDSALISLVLIYIALCMSEKKYFSKRYQVLRSVVGILIIMTKFVYIPIILLHWLNSKERKEKISTSIVYDIICVSIMLAWNIFTMISIKSISAHDASVSAIEQLKFIVYNPIQYIRVILNNMYYNFMDYIIHLDTIGWGTHTIKALVPITVLIFGIYSFIQEDNEEYQRNNKSLILMVMICIVTIIFVITALYLTWTPVGSNIVLGVQGRYFIPVIPVLMIIAKDLFNHTYISSRNVAIRASIGMYVALIYVVIFMLVNFWTRYTI